jgi:hypothetical protein
MAIWTNLSLVLLMAFLFCYTPHGRSYRVFNLETNTVVQSYDLTFNKTAPCPRDVFEGEGDKEMEDRIFVDEELQCFDGDEDEPLLPSTSSLELVPASTLEAEAPRATTSSIVAVKVSRDEGRSSLSKELLLTFRRHIHLNRS